MWTKTNNLLQKNRIWQKWWVSLLKLGYKRPTSICLALALSLSLVLFWLLVVMMQVVQGALPSGGPNVAGKGNQEVSPGTSMWKSLEPNSLSSGHELDSNVMAELQTLWFKREEEYVYGVLYLGELYKRFIDDRGRDLTGSTKAWWKFEVLALWAPLSQGAQLSCLWIPESQNLWDNCRPLSFVVISYILVDN